MKLIKTLKRIHWISISYGILLWIVVQLPFHDQTLSTSSFIDQITHKKIMYVQNPKSEKWLVLLCIVAYKHKNLMVPRFG